MVLETQQADMGYAVTGIDLRSLCGNMTGMVTVNIWVGVRTPGASSAVSVDGSAIDHLGCTNLFTDSVGSNTVDGAGANARTFTWLVMLDDSSPFTIDLGYFSPFGDLRFDYLIWICDPR